MPKTLEELQAQHAALVDEQRLLDEEIAEYRAEHAGEENSRGVIEIPNTLEYERVELEAKLVIAAAALHEALAASGGATVAVEEPVADAPNDPPDED
jgi:hypothetical protein